MIQYRAHSRPARRHTRLARAREPCSRHGHVHCCALDAAQRACQPRLPALGTRPGDPSARRFRGATPGARPSRVVKQSGERFGDRISVPRHAAGVAPSELLHGPTVLSYRMGRGQHSAAVTAAAPSTARQAAAEPQRTSNATDQQCSGLVQAMQLRGLRLSCCWSRLSRSEPPPLVDSAQCRSGRVEGSHQPGPVFLRRDRQHLGELQQVMAPLPGPTRRSSAKGSVSSSVKANS